MTLTEENFGFMIKTGLPSFPTISLNTFGRYFSIQGTFLSLDLLAAASSAIVLLFGSCSFSFPANIALSSIQQVEPLANHTSLDTQFYSVNIKTSRHLGERNPTLFSINLAFRQKIRLFSQRLVQSAIVGISGCKQQQNFREGEEQSRHLSAQH